MKTSRRFSLVFILLFFLSVAAAGDHTKSMQGNDNRDSDLKCVYTLYVKTGSIIKGGTDSNISVTLADAKGLTVSIPNLEECGLMGPNHDYFETESLDIFSVRGRCIATPICRLVITSDGSGFHHGWYVDYIQVTSTGPHIECSQTIFNVEQWIALDAPPFQLYAILDGCDDVPTDHDVSAGGGSEDHHQQQNTTTTTTTATVTVDNHARKEGVPFVVGKQHHVRFPRRQGSLSASQ